MSETPDPLLELAASITDELPVDWERERTLRPETRATLRQLEALERMARARRAGRAPEQPVLFRWGPLRALERLGEGGFAEVFRAWDPTLQREVALKLRRGGAAGGAPRWLDEARRMARVRHPHVVAIYGADLHDERAGMWMERVDGLTLEAVLAGQGPMGAREAALVGMELCGALAAVHAAGLVHGDVKSTNVMRERGGRIVLMDFGAGSELAPGEAAAPVTFASPRAAAPEVLRGHGARFQSDVYSLGALLYRLVSAKDPVAGTSFEEVLERLEREGPAPLRDVRPDLPHAFVQVIERALDVAPELRFPSMGAMATELGRFLSSEARAGADAVPSGGSARALDRRSIAVLPLVNLSDDPANEYFADGLGEDLLGQLARIPGLRVVGRTSSFQFRSRQADLREIGEKLGAGVVLEGSVRRAGERVRISVQLVSTGDGYHLWSDTYDREIADIFAVQDEIARSVATSLEVALLGTAAAPAHAPSVESYSACLRGRQQVRRGSEGDVREAIAHYRQAVALDPRNVEGWTGLSLALRRLAGFSVEYTGDSVREARAAAARALELDPDSATAHVASGMIYLFHDRDWSAAERVLRRALALAPGDTTVIGAASLLDASLGRLDEALALNRRATDLDPLNVAFWLNRGLYAWHAGQLEEAERAARVAIGLNPEFPSAHSALCRIHLSAGRPEAALEEIEREAHPGFRLPGLAMAYHSLHRDAEANAALAEAIERFANHAAFQIAEVYAWRGRAGEAFAWLERAFAQNDFGLTQLRGQPLFRGLHGDPRWSAFLRERLRLAA